MTLRITIIGAGIGAAAAALSLGLRGHQVTVLESPPALGEVGAGIQLPPNMLHLLARWGVREALVEDSVALEEVDIRRWEDGRILGTAPVNRKHGEQYVVHRADLHRVILEKAFSLPNVRLQLGATVEDVDFDSAGVTIRDGGKVKGDVVLAADGIKSCVRDKMLKNPGKPTPTGDCAYRITLPASDLRADLELRPLLERKRGIRWVGPGRHIMAYPVKRHTAYNMVLIHPDDIPDRSDESWTATASKAELLATFSGWDPVVQKLLSAVDGGTVMKWKLCTHSALEKWTRGRVALLGDACHPMLPYVAQGAAQAVEDAATLAVILSTPHYARDIPNALRVYEFLRKQRAEKIQGTAMANRGSLHLPDGPEQRARDQLFQKVSKGGVNPDRWGDPAQQAYLWGWDAETEATARLKGEKSRL